MQKIAISEVFLEPVRGVLPNNFCYKILEKEFIFSRALGV